jgi:hypothetical protein
LNYPKRRSHTKDDEGRYWFTAWERHGCYYSEQGHDPEFWAEQVTNKILGISETAAPHIRQQAEAFRSHVYQVILQGMKNSIRSDRVTITNKLRQQGHEAMANIIKEL